jgi:hypothetical protein
MIFSAEEANATLAEKLWDTFRMMNYYRGTCRKTYGQLGVPLQNLWLAVAVSARREINLHNKRMARTRLLFPPPNTPEEQARETAFVERMIDKLEIPPSLSKGMIMPPRPQGQCRSHSGGDCDWPGCPQLRDGEPARSGRSCPLLDRHRILTQTPTIPKPALRSKKTHKLTKTRARR